MKLQQYGGVSQNAAQFIGEHQYDKINAFEHIEYRQAGAGKKPCD